MHRPAAASLAEEWNAAELVSVAMALGLTVSPLDPEAGPASLQAWVEEGAVATAGLLLALSVILLFGG
ncbi:hypothetical protein [Siccirubricoccus phaeus]|uniref:hypothetical protein n=1 Tax=Siccirubricoccus phaeus TaxID=2595053 RepID=UPI0011F19256|nr:hypothetical protein [Siccirubricoccus phaeus]